MATNFPASLDSLTNPTSSDSLNSPSHSAQHANSNDAIEALQAKVGVDSSAVTTSLDYKVAQLEAISHGKILQVVSTTKTDTFSTASSSFVDITGLSVSITPTSASSKILVMAHITAGVNANSGYNLLLRDSTIILQGDAASSRPRISVAVMNTSTYEMQTTPVVFLDSPSTTSSITYKLQGRANAGATYYVNRGNGDRDTAAYDGRGTSTITVMEVSA